MAATKYGFLTQPNNTVQGSTLVGGSSQPGLSAVDQGIMVACLNADGSLDLTSTSAVTIAIGTNPGSGTLAGTLVKNAIGGIATFSDLSINIGGAGYTLSASGSLTTATSNAFTLSVPVRINPSMLVSVPSGTALNQAAGPYRFRGGRSVGGVRIGVLSTQNTDACSIFFTEAGVAPTVNSAMVPKVANYTAAATVPFYIDLDGSNLGGYVDVYVQATTLTGTMIVTFQRIEAETAP